MKYKNRLTKHYCKEKGCNNEICFKSWKYGLGRCKSCSNRARLRKEKKKYYCIEEYCFNKISRWNYFSGKKRCQLCANKITGKEKIGKKRPEHSKKMTGKNNPAYIDGHSNFPYTLEFNKELKEFIRQRDNYTCQNCGMTEEEHIIVLGEVLTVHHIDYDKQNCKENNLMALCKQCNSRVNFNRNYWKSYFKSKETINA